ncbi:MAG: hypothetical protein A2015_15490 [Spirochaetes bacterium GWF1_31_7]|nr:MAG: hypothetical protein A2Y30_11910 [Spirochaetes bacterium GWE1_32_154]OHD47269.1 MAG: hypothetical protein A2Y29_02925 [Spirochaetes bacterium GWE2_31_10]OHD52141.1 MAG: hypothetical protein A2015_15490 [Spirochaetes bacterium GWF1_31_7]OHD81254.1 MAG: hypothetical protein A2355_03515 [Spirochaetes bacterium RIFOXYB1_FULL_32_8]HBD96325.1 hypothetical protein [Spirochaetia bacterium]
MITIHNSVFNAKRFFYLLKNELFGTMRFYSIFLGIIGGLILLSGIMSGFNITTTDYSNFTGVIIIAGLIMASKAFPATYDTEQLIAFLMVPVSNVERFAAKLINTLFILFIASITTIIITSSFIKVISFISHGTALAFFNPFTLDMLQSFGFFIVLHSIYFTGSLLFKSSRFMKTTLSIIAFFIITGISVMTFMSLSLVDFFMKSFGSTMPNSFGVFNDSMNFPVLSVVWNIFLILLPIALYSISYIRMKKLEVK